MKKPGQRMRIILIASVFMVIANAILGSVLIYRARSAMKTQLDGRLLDIVNTASKMLDGDALAVITDKDAGTPPYDGLYNSLSTFQDNTGMEYIYAIRQAGDGGYVIVLDPAEENVAEYGQQVLVTDALLRAAAGTPSVSTSYEDSFGRFYTAYSLVYDSDGRIAGLVAADFDADWYEAQLNQSSKMILSACVMFLVIGIALVVFMTRQYNNQMQSIRQSLSDLEEDLNSLTGEDAGRPADHARPTLTNDSIQSMGEFISDLRDELHDHISAANTRARNMINAMASDYRCVYYINLDENDAVCYRGDPADHEHTPEGVHFPFVERFRWYGMHSVTESYRDGFLHFIDPDNIRQSLGTQPVIAYRYLAKREGREYYEMIRMAGVRRTEDRDDDLVHAIGIGFTEIDAEMREAMAKNDALAEALSVAEEANKAKTAFLSNMSHEIRTPMNAIIGLDTLALRDESLPPQTRDYLEKIGGSARHLLELINDILDMSRIESGRIILRKEEFSFSAMLEQINTMVMSQCRDKGLSYECRILNRVDDHYIGDDTKLKEVLINILSNAIKFTEAPGSVTMTVERAAAYEEQSTLKFCIRDTGIGMDKDYIPKIFDAFSQEDSSRKNKYGSTGLGMAITKSIVEMMNGRISVQSEKGVGSEFTVTVTLRNCDSKDSSRDNDIDSSRMRVLVVDDEEIAAEHARMVLDEVGIRADVCMSGQEALQMLEVQHVKQEPYNLVLMDWKMPEMDGLETAKQIRERYSNETTVIILTAYNWDEIMDEAMASGVDSFLSKPLFASNVLSEFERVARRNNMSLFKEKKRASLDGRRILLAEDIEINAEIMIDILDMKAALADHAENGKIALEKFRDNPPGTYSAILMDVRMPEMDGLEATAAIRALDRPDAKKIPIIALTANAFDEDVQRSLQAGMNAHLSKPVEPDHLYRTLEELIYEAEEG